MAPTVRSTSGAVHTAGTSHPITLPSGIVTGDLLLLVFIHDHATNQVEIPQGGLANGWVSVDRQVEGGTTNLGGNLIWKRATSTNSLTITTTESQEAAYICVAIQDAPDDPLIAGGSSGGGTPVQPPVLGVPTGDYLPLIFVGLDQNSPPTPGETLGTSGSGYTAVRNETPSSTTGSWVSAHLLAADALHTGVSSIAPPTFTPSGGTDQSVSWTIGIPASVAVPNVPPGDIINIGTAAGRVHFGFDIAEAGASARVLYEPSQIDAGLDIDPEFTGTDSDTWVQCSVRANAPTTSGSTNPRVEGREYQEGSDTTLGFNPKDGNTHWMRVRTRIMEHPLLDNVGVCTAQLHSAQDDIVMVRTRMSGTTTNNLVLRVYDPGTANTVDVLTLIAGYAFGTIYDIMLLIHNRRVYVFLNDFTVPVYSFDESILPTLSTYFFKTGAYAQINSNVSTAWYTSNIKNVNHHHAGWTAPQNYFGAPTVNPGAAATATAGVQFNRTFTETGSGITERKWTILSGPTGVGTTIGTAAALAWTPTVSGDYVLMAGAKNAEGWNNPTFLPVTVASGSATQKAGSDSFALVETASVVITPVGGGGQGPPEIDASSPARTTTGSGTATSIATASFTPPGDSVLVATIHKDGTTPANSATFSGGGLTWTRLQQTQATNGGTAIGYAVVPAGGVGAMTVSGTFSGASANNYTIKVDVLTGVDPGDILGFQTSGSYTGTSGGDLTVGPFNAEIQGDSLMVVAATAAVTSGSNSLTPSATGFDDFNAFNVNSEIRGGRGIATSSDSATYTIDGPSTLTYYWNWVAVEFRGFSGPLQKAAVETVSLSEARSATVTTTASEPTFGLTDSALIYENKAGSLEPIALTEQASISVVLGRDDTQFTLTEAVSGYATHVRSDDLSLTEALSNLQLEAITGTEAPYTLAEQYALTESYSTQEDFGFTDISVIGSRGIVATELSFTLEETASLIIVSSRTDNLTLFELHQISALAESSDASALTDLSLGSVTFSREESFLGFGDAPGSQYVTALRTDNFTLAETYDFVIAPYSSDGFTLTETVDSITSTLGTEESFTLIEWGSNEQTELPPYIFGVITQPVGLYGETVMANQMQVMIVNTNTMRATIFSVDISGEVSQPGLP